MSKAGDALRIRVLFKTWRAKHKPLSIKVAHHGEVIHRRSVMARLTSLAGRHKAAEYVYVLSERRPDEVTPAYIGKTRSPAIRWNQHLTALGHGKGHYARWCQRFLREGHETVRFDLDLLVVGEAHIAFPPLPDFLSTIGAVEYQLVGLAADAYPLRLLNHEGQAR